MAVRSCEGSEPPAPPSWTAEGGRATATTGGAGAVGGRAVHISTRSKHTLQRLYHGNTQMETVCMSEWVMLALLAAAIGRSLRRARGGE